MQQPGRSRNNSFRTSGGSRSRARCASPTAPATPAAAGDAAKARSLERAYQNLEGRLKRVPTDAELAAAVGLEENHLQSILAQVSFVGLAALDETLGIGERNGGSTLGETLADRADGPVAVVETAETRRILAACIAALPERERVVLTLYYYEGLTLAEIGSVLSVTESRVSQVHTKAVIHLRARLAAADRDRI